MDGRSPVPMENLDTMQLQGGIWMFIAWYSRLTVLVGTLTDLFFTPSDL